MPADDVSLTDLEVIQRFSLAVRGATASREDVVRALEADLAWLSGGRRTSGDDAPAAAAPAKRVRRAPAKSTARRRPASEA